MLGGMIVWTAHFFSLYAVASILGSSMPARLLTVLITLPCLLADGALLTRALRAFGSNGPTEWPGGWPRWAASPRQFRSSQSSGRASRRSSHEVSCHLGAARQNW
jgi:hypothetical protein